MASIYSTHDLSKVRERKIFFDANVLISIFWPNLNLNHWSKYYTSAFRYLLEQRNPIFIDFIIVSEVVNSVLRSEHRKYIFKYGELGYKKFRNRKEGIEISNDVFAILKDNIFTQFEIVGKGFSKADIDNLLVVDTMDFNDKAIAAICKENNLVLLTNDYDFKGTDIDILTSNPAILHN